MKDMTNLLTQFNDLVMECPMERYSAYGQNCVEELSYPGYGRITDYYVFHLPFLRKYSEWYAGSSRAAYMDHERGVVYKVPTTKRGLEDNRRDAHFYQLQEKGKGDVDQPIAWCVLHNDLVLEMEMVTPVDPSEAPKNFRQSDGFQIGRTKAGKIVFFDL